MIVTTTSTIQGKEIIDYVDIVNGEAIMGANIVRDLLLLSVTLSVVASGAYESKLKEARDIAMEEMKTLARQKMRMPSLVSMWITK
ncbi:heavy metal-binding domain-containing protein [Bacillus cereus]